MTVDHTKGKLLYEGKAKKIFSTSDSSKLIQEFKDSLTAFNAQKKGSFKGKGEVNLQITTCIFKYLSAHGISTHFLERIDAQDMLVEKLNMIPLEVVVRNRAAGSISLMRSTLKLPFFSIARAAAGGIIFNFAWALATATSTSRRH